MNRERILLWTAAAPFLLLLIVVGVAAAGSVTIPTTFTPNTVADANQVNANFSAIAVAVNDNDSRITANAAAIAALPATPRVWAQVDADVGGVAVTSSTSKEVSSLAINAPANGVLVISGQVYVANNEATSTVYSLRPSLDGTFLDPGSFTSTFHCAASGSAGEYVTLQYTIATPVTAGNHTVAQTIEPAFGAADFFHNREYLTVTFLPTGTVTQVNSPSP